MEVENQETETEIENNEPVVEDTVSEQAEETGEAGEETPTEPAPYEPNHKYSFMDQEHEFDDKIKGYIKTKEDEDFFRDMVTSNLAHQKYKELGSVRDLESKLSGYEGLTETQQKYETVNQEIDTLGKMIQNGNIEQFREYLGIPKEQLLQWAVNEAKAQQDPQYGQQLNQQYQDQQQQFNLQLQNNMMQNQIEQTNVAQFNNEMQSTLENNETAQAYDNLVGKPGSFRQAVMEYGTAYYGMHGKDPSIAEAVQAVQAKFQPLITSNSVGTQSTQQQTQPASDPANTVVINQGGKKTLPNLQGGNTSPAKKQIRSLAELKEHARNF